MAHKLLEFKPDEYQQIMLEVKSQKHFAKFLGISEDQAKEIIRKQKVLFPPEYVRAQTEEYLIERLMIHGSFQKLAGELGVSRAFLLKHLQKLKVPSKFYEAKPRFTKTVFEEEIKRIGSVRMMARIHQTTEAHIRQRAGTLGLNLAELIDATTSGYNTGKGARAEELFEEQRASVEYSMNKTNGSQAPYDFKDTIFGKVNVKASKSYSYKAKSRAKKKYWKFSTKGCKNADVFALMFFDDKHQKHLYTMFVTAESIVGLDKKTITIDEDTVKPVDINSISHVDLTDDMSSIEE